MKKCPACNQQFSDEYAFCLNDGTNLVPAGITISYDQEQQTVVRSGEQNTVVRPGGTAAATPPSARSGGIPFYMWLFPLLGLIIGIGLIGGYVILSKVLSSGTTTVANTNTNTFPTSPTPFGGTPPSTISPTPVVTPMIDRTPPPAPTPQTTPPPQLATYPSTTRLKFARGAVATSFSGDVNPGGSRAVVLACRAGQSLSASVTSTGGCISIRGGGSSYRTYTSGGDNYITLTNSCSNVSHFNLSVSVL
ncbi:MAG: hypothetical protein JO053_02620 [Acidobacteria bacterium]|nr:hypothetical protein [Acidobacteriota bacterium]